MTQSKRSLWIVLTLIAVLVVWIAGCRKTPGSAGLEGEIWIDASANPGGDGTKNHPLAALPDLTKGLMPGAVLHIRAGKPLVGNIVLKDVKGTAQKPIVIRGEGETRATILGRAKLIECQYVKLERLAFEPLVADTKDNSFWVSAGGENIELLDCMITGTPGDGLVMAGKNNAVRGGRIAACDRFGISLSGNSTTTIEGVRIESCGNAGIETGGQDVAVVNCLLLHNRGAAIFVDGGLLKAYNNLIYDNSGGIHTDNSPSVEIINNIFVNNYATTLLSMYDVEVAAPDSAKINHNVYFRHPGKDKLLRGLPYGQGVDLSPLRPDNPFGLRLRVDGKVVFSLTDPAWAAKFDKDSLSLDIVQRFTGPNSYTRSYEDLFADFQKEDFHPRFTSPAVGRGENIDAVKTDIEGKPRLASHADIGPYAAPADWWKDIDSGKATIVDGTVPLDAAGRDLGLGTAAKPFSSLAKALAFGRWGSRIYVKDSIYRDTAMQTSFSFGPEGTLSGFPGQRPAFSPSECIAPARWEKFDSGGKASADLYRIRDWHTFLGGNCRHNAWMEDWYGNFHIGGPEANVTSLSRDRAKLAEPFRRIGHIDLDRDTSQLLWDGIALQPAGGVLGMEDFGIGVASVWGRDPSHLRPGSFIVGRRELLLSKAVGAGSLKEGQCYLEGPNRHPEMSIRVNDKVAGYVSGFLAQPATAWQTVQTYPTGDKLWQLDAATVAKLGKNETRVLSDGWKKVRADKDSAWWVRQFALPTFAMKLPGGQELARQQAQIDRSAMPLNSWRQRQNQTGDPELAAVFDNPYQDCLEVRLPSAVDPGAPGLTAEYFNARVEGLWRGTVVGSGPAVNKAGAIMLSEFRTMEALATPEATAATAGYNWSFGFLVPMGQSAPTLLMRMPAFEDDPATPNVKKAVDPNTEDFWRLAVVDDCLYVFPPLSEVPAKHVVDIACNSGLYVYGTGGNSGFMDWHDAGTLKNIPTAKVFSTELDFDHEAYYPLWAAGQPGIPTQGFEIDLADPAGKTIHILDNVRLDASGPGDKILTFTYFEGNPASPTKKEFKVNSKDLRPDRKVVLPSQPISFPDRMAFAIAPAGTPQQMAEQQQGISLKTVATRAEIVPGTCFYDGDEHRFYVCPSAGSLPYAGGWSGCRYEPLATLRGLYLLGGNSYGHQKQYGWGSGLNVPSRLIDDVSVGFSTTGVLSGVPGTECRDCLFRWAQSEIGGGGEVSGDVRHTADRIKKPQLHVKHCTFDIANSFLFDGNDNPTKNIPFGNHHIWEDNTFVSIMAGLQACWWDQYCFNNVVQNNLFIYTGGTDVECCENLMARNNIFANEKRSAVTYRGSDRGYVISNTAFRGGGLWFDSEPQRANATEQGQPCYGPTFPTVRRGPIRWMSNSELGHETGLNLTVQWLPAPDHPEVYYCENWTFATPMLIDAQGFAAYTSVGALAAMKRGTYYTDTAAKRLYVQTPDGKQLQSAMPAPHIPQSDAVRRDLIYTLTVTRAGRLSMPYRVISPTELEIIEPLKPGSTVQATYFVDKDTRKQEGFPVTAAAVVNGPLRIKLAAKPADDRLFVGMAGEEPPKVRVTSSQGPEPRPGLLNDVVPFDAELIPGSSIVASRVMGMKFNILRGYFDEVKAGDQFETVFQSRSVYHFSSLDNCWLDLRSWDPSDGNGNACHGVDFMVNTEQTNPDKSQIDYNCYWKDLHAVPGPLTACVNWGKPLFARYSGEKEGASREELFKATGYEEHGMTPPSYFTLVANPLRYDFRPLPDSPLIGAGVASKQEVGEFLFDPDQGNGNQTFTFKGNERDMVGNARHERPTIGAIENPLPGARAWYMATDGKDADGRGAKDAPLATAAYALARMRPGDVLVLKAGTYKQQIVIDRSGTSRDFLAIVAEAPPYDTPPRFPTPGQVIIDASGLGDQPAILLKGCGHVRVAGLKVIGSKAKPAAVELRDTRDCVLEYIFVEKPDTTGIRATGRENTLYECCVKGGNVGYDLSGSLTDARWCASEGSFTGFQALNPSAGLHLLQNRHWGEGKAAPQCGFLLGEKSSDLVLDGNWASGSIMGYDTAGARLLLVNNNAFQNQTGISVKEGKDIRVFNNSLLGCVAEGLKIADKNDLFLALNNVIQASGQSVTTPKATPAMNVVLDYNLYSTPKTPLQFQATTSDKTFTDLAAWTAATGCDRNSLVAPLICQRMRDKNGRVHLRPEPFSVSSMTHDFNVGPDSLIGAPYSGGGSFVPDVPENWKPCGMGVPPMSTTGVPPVSGHEDHGQDARGTHGQDGHATLYEFSAAPNPGAAAAYCYWYCARVDYRQKDGKRKAVDMVKVDLPPGQIPPGTFCQDTVTGKLYFRMPSDASEPCPIGKHNKVAPQQAVGYYVGRLASGPKEKYFGKLVDAKMAAEMEKDGVKEVDAVANVLTCLCGTPGLEKGTPISGLARDCDSMPRPGMPGGFPTLGWYNGPGMFDIGAWECGYWTP
jgi:hypothetical protein